MSNNSALVCDTAKLRELASTIDAKLKLFLDHVSDMEVKINELETSGVWTGEAYKSFQSYCKTFITTEVSTIKEEMLKWIDSINNTADDGDDNTKANQNLFAV